MPCANCAASLYPGPFVPLGRRGRWSSCGVIIALMSALVSPSTSGRSRKVMYHFSESITVLQQPRQESSKLLLEVTFPLQTFDQHPCRASGEESAYEIAEVLQDLAAMSSCVHPARQGGCTSPRERSRRGQAWIPDLNIAPEAPTWNPRSPLHPWYRFELT